MERGIRFHASDDAFRRGLHHGAARHPERAGATAVEYAIFIGLIAAVMIFAVMFLGKETYKNFQCPTSRGCEP